MCIASRYLPIEQDASLTIDEKLPDMRDWYRLNHAVYVKADIRRSMLTEAVAASIKQKKLVLRSGAAEAMDIAAVRLRVDVRACECVLTEVLFVISPLFPRCASPSVHFNIT